MYLYCENEQFKHKNSHFHLVCEIVTYFIYVMKQ